MSIIVRVFFFEQIDFRSDFELFVKLVNKQQKQCQWWKIERIRDQLESGALQIKRAIFNIGQKTIVTINWIYENRTIWVGNEIHQVHNWYDSWRCLEQKTYRCVENNHNYCFFHWIFFSPNINKISKIYLILNFLSFIILKWWIKVILIVSTLGLTQLRLVFFLFVYCLFQFDS